jgi:hypothetical protein
VSIDLPLYQVRPEQMDLSAKETELFNELLAIWQQYLDGNIRNEAYYKGKLRVVSKDQNSPEELQKLKVVMGWGGKCVDVLAGRSVLKEFTSQGTGANDLLNAVGNNDLITLYEQAVTSELTDSCSFMTVSKGAPGEPDVIISAHSALDAVAIYDYRKKRIKAGLVVLDIEEDENKQRKPTWVNMYTDEKTYSMRLLQAGIVGSEHWVTEIADNPLDRPLMEPLVYRPSIIRPFGKSRINRTVRSLIDRALAVGARTETSAVFYTWPQRYLLNVDKKTVQEMASSKMGMYVDRMLLVSTNKNGDSPQYGQLSQMTMQPHIDHLEMLAKQFASEACVPLDEVGIVFDNPSSADAMYAAQQRLIVEAEHVNRINGAALKNVALIALACIRNAQRIEELSDDDKTIIPRFENPLRPSMAARADYAIKVASAVPEYAQTRYFWEDLGYEKADIDGIMREVRQAQTSNIIAQMAAQQAARTPTPIPQAGGE